MPLAGDFHTMPPAELLQWLSLSHKTGTLAVTSGDNEAQLVFIEGRVVSTGSSDPETHLGSYLAREGFITPQERQRVMEVQHETQTSLGKLLVSIGAISEDDLLSLLRKKAEEEIFSLFFWEGARFLFEAEEVPDLEIIPLDIDPLRLILEASRRVDESRRSIGPPSSGPTTRYAETYITFSDRSGARYHRSDCSREGHDHPPARTFMTRQEAEAAGLAACRFCSNDDTATRSDP